MNSLYYVFIDSKLLYCIEIWDNASKYTLSPLIIKVIGNTILHLLYI